MSDPHSRQNRLDQFESPTAPADRVYTTNHVALRKNEVVPPDSAFIIGVVTKTHNDLGRYVDDNYQTLAPPLALRGELYERAHTVGHNQAWEDVDFKPRYEAYLTRSAPQDELEDLITRVIDGQQVWLVGYHDREKKRCHRHLLKSKICEELPSA